MQQEREPISNLKKTHEYQTDIVLKTIEAGVEQLKLSFMLHKIVENPKILESCLKGTPHEKCLNLVLEFREQTNIQLSAFAAEIPKQLLNIIDHFHENYDVLKYLTNWNDDYDKQEMMFLKSFLTLYNLAKEHFALDPRDKLLEEKPTHELYILNEKYKRNIKDLMWKNRFNKANLWKQAAKAGLLKDLEDELDEIRAEDQIEINKKIIESSKEMRKLNNAFISKQRELDEEYEKVCDKYNNDLQNDLKKEKTLRDEKNKFQSQLEMLINKYNQVMSEKQNEESQLDQTYADLKVGFTEFMVEYDREFETYEKIAGDWERKRQKRIVLWSRNYLARKIQRWWKRAKRAKRRLERRKAAREAKMAAMAAEKPKAIKRKSVARKSIKKPKGKK